MEKSTKKKISTTRSKAKTPNKKPTSNETLEYINKINKSIDKIDELLNELNNDKKGKNKKDDLLEKTHELYKDLEEIKKMKEQEKNTIPGVRINKKQEPKVLDENDDRLVKEEDLKTFDNFKEDDNLEKLEELIDLAKDTTSYSSGWHIVRKKKVKLKSKYVPFFLAFVFITVFLLTSSITYGFFTTRVTSKDIVVYTGDLAVNFQKDGDVINIENAIPMSDTDGMNQAGYTFKVANTGTINALYQIRLEEYIDGSSNLPLEYIKMSYSKNNGTYSEPVLLSSLEENLVFTKDNLIDASNGLDTYTLKLWIDIHAPNEVQNKEFKARVVIDSTQELDGEYVYDNPPVINLNKDQNNNTDINLLVGEAYTELGVASVVDDKDTLQVSNVVTSIQKLVRDTNDNNIYKLTTVNSIDTSTTGVYYVNYAITDTNNNTGRSVRVVTVNKTQVVPTITLNGNQTTNVLLNTTYNEKGAVSSTNDPVITLGEVKTSTQGVYIVRYITVDNLGNIASTTRTVNVKEKYADQILNGTDPVLKGDLVPVTIVESGDDAGKVYKADLTSNWYSYEDKKWANAVILTGEDTYSPGDLIEEQYIESYFVWIPKYSYRLFDMGDYNNGISADGPSTSIAHTINIEFGLDNTTETDDSCITPLTSGSSGGTGATRDCKVGDLMTHPAFITMNTNGLWVGKFETGYKDATSNDEKTYTTINKSEIVVKPNVYSWRGISIGNMFTTALSYNTNLDSHMMKNTEWGAVAILSHSNYGINTEVNINNNSDYLTGYSALPSTDQSDSPGESGNTPAYTSAYNTEVGYLASTTGNITGIYDMSGGAHEYVAGYRDSQDASVSEINPTSYDSKYFDIYNSASGAGTYKYRILGDATGEMGPFYNYKDGDTSARNHNSWYADNSYFVYSSGPWFYRGGRSSQGVVAGQFYFNRATGDVSPIISFRIVLAPTE